MSYLHYIRSCFDKKQYRSKADAEHARALWGVQAVHFHIYKCEHCNNWHVGGHDMPKGRFQKPKY